MKYETPKYELIAIESEDVITASSVKVESAGNGKGNASIDAGRLFD
jgi:hypothetical protein